MAKPRLAPDDRKWNNHSRSNLEHDAAIVRAAQAGGAVEVFAGLGEDQASVGLSSVRAGEAVQHAVFPLSVGSRGQLEHYPGIVDAAPGGRAVHISCFIQNHCSEWSIAALIQVEGMKYGFLPPAIRKRGEFED